MWPFTSSNFELTPDAVGTPTLSPSPAIDDRIYDYIIVGGGSAGCCLAARLSENSSVSVLLLEQGDVADTWASRVPLISGNLFRSGTQATRWPTLPMSQVDNRVLEVVCGEALGGTSRVNGMVYTRGAPAEYDRWKEMGHPEWGYKELLPYFLKSEATLNRPPSDYHGRKGPWETQIMTEAAFPITPHLRDACTAIGFPIVDDMNAPDASSIGYTTLDITMNRKFFRNSTYLAFLPPHVILERKSHLKISTKTLVTRIITSNEEIPHAFAVEFEALKETGPTPPRKFYAKARREIIVCAGAISSPHLLMLSGIGPKDEMKAHGIDVVRDLPGVGSYLKDHVGLPVMYDVPMGDSLHAMQNSILKPIKELVKYLLTGRGTFSLPFMQNSLFVSSRVLNDKMEVDRSQDFSKDIPDMEIMPVAYNCSDVVIEKKGIFSFLTAMVQPKSFGSVRLASKNPRDDPRVDLGYLTNPDDYAILRKCTQLSMRLAEQIKGQGYLLKELQVPGDDVDLFIRTHLRTSYHYSCTCRMASEAEAGVVDDSLKVHGVGGLRVCDTSIFPEIIANHTMAPAVMVAEKCADMIQKEWATKS